MNFNVHYLVDMIEVMTKEISRFERRACCEPF